MIVEELLKTLNNYYFRGFLADSDGLLCRPDLRLVLNQHVLLPILRVIVILHSDIGEMTNFKFLWNATVYNICFL